MSKHHFGGLSTAPDVKKLDEAFPTLREDQILTADELAAIIGEAPGSRRFRTVLHAWCNHVAHERNQAVVSLRGIGYHVLCEPGRIQRGAQQFRLAVRGIGRAGESLAAIRSEKLDDADKRRLDHARRLVDTTAAAARQAVRDLPPDLKPQPRLPLRAVSGDSK